MLETRVIQLASDLAYLLLGVVAVGAALRWPDRVRVDLALLFGASGLSVIIQEVPPLIPGADVRLAARFNTLLVMALPYLLLRLVEDVHDLPRRLTAGWIAVALLLGMLLLVVPPGLMPPVRLAATAYLVFGILYPGWEFARRGTEATGITRRRMRAAAAACVSLALSFLVALGSLLDPSSEIVFTTLSQVAALLAGIGFWAAFFPPRVLRDAWRLPELFQYLRSTRAHEGAELPEYEPSAFDQENEDAVAIHRLTTALVRTLGASRPILTVVDPERGDVYVWGEPTLRSPRGVGLTGRVIETGKPVFERTLRLEDMSPSVRELLQGQPAPRSVLVVPVKIEGRTVGALGATADKGPIFVDDDVEVLRFFAAEVAAILRSREHRATTRELAALREADRLKDEFIATVSHELRTPLTAISGYADILRRQVSGPLNERQDRQVKGIKDAAGRLLALINDLIDVSKLESGTLVLHQEEVAPQEAIASALEETRLLASSKGVEVSTDVAARLPGVSADPQRLQQMLVNLIGNAIKFTPSGGLICVGAASADSADEGYIAFSVRDTGIGIPPDQLSLIWERFYQADSSSTRRYGGTGLGLAIVRRLAELHGGRVAASSNGPAGGTTFTIYLPAASRELALSTETRASLDLPARADSADSHRQTTARGLVLVVEDDPDIASVMRTTLEDEGYRVEVAVDGQQAIQLARQMQPVAITLDVMLPKLDGWSVLNALKRDPLTANLPVVVVSIVDNKEFGMVLGASDYLVKPIDQQRLRNVIGRLAA